MPKEIQKPKSGSTTEARRHIRLRQGYDATGKGDANGASQACHGWMPGARAVRCRKLWITNQHEFLQKQTKPTRRTGLAAESCPTFELFACTARWMVCSTRLGTVAGRKVQGPKSGTRRGKGAKSNGQWQYGKWPSQYILPAEQIFRNRSHIRNVVIPCSRKNVR